MQKMDASLVTRQWKLKLFKACICPWLTWKFSVAEFLLTWFETTIQPLTTLASWQKLSEVTVVFLCFSGHSPPYLSALFKPSSQVHQHETRSSTSKGLLIPHSRTNHGKKSFAFRGSKSWNALPPRLRDIKNLDTFATAARKHVLSYTL